jgi:hypothetical protein
MNKFDEWWAILHPIDNWSDREHDTARNAWNAAIDEALKIIDTTGGYDANWNYPLIKALKS